MEGSDVFGAHFCPMPASALRGFHATVVATHIFSSPADEGKAAGYPGHVVTRFAHYRLGRLTEYPVEKILNWSKLKGYSHGRDACKGMTIGNEAQHPSEGG